MSDHDLQIAEEVNDLVYGYNKFLNAMFASFNSGDAQVHPHAAPALSKLYALAVEDIINVDANPDRDVEAKVLTAIDFITRYVFELAALGKTYADYTQCSCFTLTDQDLIRLTEAE